MKETSKKICSGYQGKPDPLRERAERMMSSEMISRNHSKKFGLGGSLSKVVASKAAKGAGKYVGGTLASKIPFGKNMFGTGVNLGDMLASGVMNLKKGGKIGGAYVSTPKARHGLTKEQTDMKIPRKVEMSGNCYKNGGLAREESSYRKKNGNGRYGIGGKFLGGVASVPFNKLGNKAVGNILGSGVGLGDVLGSMIGTAGGFLPFKKGGHANSGRKKSHYDEGGGVPGVDYVAKKGGHMKRHTNSHRERLEHEMNREFSRNETVNRKSHGSKRYGFGGGAAGAVAGSALSPFLRKIPVVGGLLGTAAPFLGGALGGILSGPFKEGGHAEGGKMRRGGKAIRRAVGGTIYERQMVGERPSSRKPDMNYTSEMRGEKPVRSRMAMGGSGKIRHKEASRSGSPLNRRSYRSI